MANQRRVFTLETLIMADKMSFVSIEHVFDTLRLVDWVSGEPNCGHQLPRALEQIGPFLRKDLKLAFLADIPDPDHVNTGWQWNQYLNEQIRRFGSSHEVPQMPRGTYDNWDPIHAQQEMEERDAEEQAKADLGNQLRIPGGPSITVDDTEIAKLLGGHVTIVDLFGPDNL